MKEIVLTEADIKKCQKNGLLKDLKIFDGRAKILRGPKRLLRKTKRDN